MTYISPDHRRCTPIATLNDFAVQLGSYEGLTEESQPLKNTFLRHSGKLSTSHLSSAFRAEPLARPALATALATRRSAGQFFPASWRSAPLHVPALPGDPLSPLSPNAVVLFC